MTILGDHNQFYIEIPLYVHHVLDKFSDAGYEAYIVGGCVRDALMGKEPNDWDVCTSALPKETLAVFADERTIETGLKHGTVTVLSDENPVEVTTYRIDGEYLDGRHLEKVEFTRSLEEDLARRDFTINAMAYHHEKGLVDPYGGREDLHAGCLRCVGDPSKRFREDALRIMRGLRFSATLGFSIEAETASAMYKEKNGLRNISKERINAELSKLLMGEGADLILRNHIEILGTVATGIQLPQSDLKVLPKNLTVRLAEVFPKDTAHHLKALKYDNHTIRNAGALSGLKGSPALTEPKREMLHFLQKHGEVITELHYARAGEDALASLKALLEEHPCYRMEELAISGNDLIKAGVHPGPKMGELLETLVDLVIEEKVENERNALMTAVKEAIRYE